MTYDATGVPRGCLQVLLLMGHLLRRHRWRARVPGGMSLPSSERQSGNGDLLHGEAEEAPVVRDGLNRRGLVLD
jgi:hypothetical protein